MSNEKRYSVWAYARTAMKKSPNWATWDEAKREYDRLKDDRFHIWDHSTTPPTDVTDADPEAEKRWWVCFWDSDTGYKTKENSHNQERIAVEFVDGTLWQAQGLVASATEPTFAEFAAAVKDVTGVEIPQPEKPQWWWWDGEEWLAAIGTGVQLQRARRYECVIWATTADRDAKRDALLAAAREAGKP